MEKKRELTFRGFLIGLFGLIIITASSLYVALRMGALPWPTVFVTVVSFTILKWFKNSTLEEINVTHTMMSSGAMVAGGVAFTLPGIWILNEGAQVSPLSLVLLTMVGALLGGGGSSGNPLHGTKQKAVYLGERAPLSHGTSGLQHPHCRHLQRARREAPLLSSNYKCSLHPLQGWDPPYTGGLTPLCR